MQLSWCAPKKFMLNKLIRSFRARYRKGNKGNEVQLVNYLNSLQKDIGLLINFNPSGVDVKRKYRHTK